MTLAKAAKEVPAENTVWTSPAVHSYLGVGNIIGKISIADISAFLQLIGKLLLSKKIDLGIIKK